MDTGIVVFVPRVGHYWLDGREPHYFPVPGIPVAQGNVQDYIPNGTLADEPPHAIAPMDNNYLGRQPTLSEEAESPVEDSNVIETPVPGMPSNLPPTNPGPPITWNGDGWFDTKPGFDPQPENWDQFISELADDVQGVIRDAYSTYEEIKDLFAD